MLTLTCPPSFLAALGKVRKEDIASCCEWKRDDSVNNEEPTP